MNRLFLLLGISLVLLSCGNGKTETTDKKDSTSTVRSGESVVLVPGSDTVLLKIDYNEDLSKRTVQDLRILRNIPYAKQGYCFMQADLRGYFTARMQGYDSILNARYDYDPAHPPADIKLSAEEEAYCKKAAAMEKEKLKNNFADKNGIQLANVNNIANFFQFKGLSGDFMNMLDKNNFVIVPSDKIQLFHTYEANDYSQVPNFVTTDLYLQLYHMYFGFVLRSLEEQKFIPIISELSDGMYTEAMKAASTASDPNLKATAEYTAVFYAIPYYILTGKKKPVPDKYKAQFDKELASINAEADGSSTFLGQEYFGYSLFKPRGHYTRSEQLKKYFKAMMWLQTASFCRDKQEQLQRTVFMAALLNSGRSGSGKSLLSLYNSVFEPIVFLIGEPDNLSVNDITSFLTKNNAKDISSAMQPAMLQKTDAYLQEIVKGRNRIKPKVEVTCADKINFMPQRYLFDNEIIQNLADVKPNAKRAYPKGLDIFAALGNKAAENILTNEYKEGDNWKEYPGEMDKLKKQFANYPLWNAAVYNKWMYSLFAMQGRDPSYPSFMQTDMWDRKNLYTSLGSWAELKHDAILYGEQPMAAECGGGGPPDPITVGYVEPNVKFWQSMIELLTLTQNMLQKNGLVTEDITDKTKQLHEAAQFLLSASQKEIKHQKLSEQEYKTIEAIGASTEYLTLSILEPGKSYSHWEDVQGPDKSLAVVADVYTRNIPDSKDNGILHEAVGNVNELYVVVEIEGYLYLTKGAMFSYYEFLQQPGTRLTDEEWQKKLESKKDLPPIPQWMKDLILPQKDAPSVDEKIFYSSGC